MTEPAAPAGPVAQPLARRVPVPDWLAGHAERFAASGAPPASPRFAATVLLLRPAATGFEVYLQRRVSTMAFAASMYAFPGGSVDVADRDLAIEWVGPSAGQWAQRLGLDPATAQAVVLAAVRELFEEAGVLLAGVCGASTSEPVGLSTLERELARQALLARKYDLAEWLSTADLCVRADLLVAWSRWVTPEFEPRRFDTFFFVARLPAGESAQDVSGEADHCLWLAPAEAAALPMLPPTAATLAELATFDDIDAVIAASASRVPRTPIMPRLEIDETGAWMVVR